MAKNTDFGQFARHLAVKYPTLNNLLLHVFQWIIAYIILAVLSHLVVYTLTPSLNISSLKANLIIAVFFGFFYGLASGYVGQLFERRFFLGKALWIIIIGKALLSLFIFIILISVVRSVLFPYLYDIYFSEREPGDTQQAWDGFFYLLLIYTVVAGLVISFINQVTKKYGPGVLFPLLLGRYRKPREEERVFLFMDLKSSTAIAEALGHLKYSAFIRDSFMDINRVLADYYAQIYQYVGDEMVITWTIREGIEGSSCIRFFFSCQEQFKKREGYYIKTYGQMPEFKAGLHMGPVTAVEVGNIKRDIAYHGDTINTTARIQSVCNKYNKRFLVSRLVVEKVRLERRYKYESLGLIELKGKSKAVEIIAIEMPE